jgi:hypothetical protein
MAPDHQCDVIDIEESGEGLKLEPLTYKEVCNKYRVYFEDGTTGIDFNSMNDIDYMKFMER